MKARMILMLTEGFTYVQIQERLQTTEPTTSRWKRQFLEKQVLGLAEARHPGQKPAQAQGRFHALVLPQVGP